MHTVRINRRNDQFQVKFKFWNQMKFLPEIDYIRQQRNIQKKHIINVELSRHYIYHEIQIEVLNKNIFLFLT